MGLIEPQCRRNYLLIVYEPNVSSDLYSLECPPTSARTARISYNHHCTLQIEPSVARRLHRFPGGWHRFKVGPRQVQGITAHTSATLMEIAPSSARTSAECRNASARSGPTPALFSASTITGQRGLYALNLNA